MAKVRAVPGLFRAVLALVFAAGFLAGEAGVAGVIGGTDQAYAQESSTGWPQQAGPQQGLVKVNAAMVHIRPSEGAEEAIRLLMNTVVAMVAEKEGWWLVLAPGEGDTAGWIKKEEVAAITPAEYWSRFTQMATVRVDVAVVRTEASRLSPPLTTVFLHTRLGIAGEAGDWIKVALPGGEVGWIYRELLDVGEIPSKMSLAGREGRFAFIDNLVATAQGFLGAPYRWGGRSRQGFDCSGLIYTVFAMNGIALPRETGPQYAATQAVPKDVLTRGDLVFFTTYQPGPSHVGLYLGRGRFIHASSRRGVIVSRLDDPYYAARFLGARRVPPPEN